MATYAVTDTQLKNIADKIRSKLGTSDLIGVDDMPAEIEKISGGGGDDGWMKLPDFTTTSSTKWYQTNIGPRSRDTLLPVEFEFTIDNAKGIDNGGLFWFDTWNGLYLSLTKTDISLVNNRVTIAKSTPSDILQLNKYKVYFKYSKRIMICTVINVNTGVTVFDYNTDSNTADIYASGPLRLGALSTYGLAGQIITDVRYRIPEYDWNYIVENFELTSSNRYLPTGINCKGTSGMRPLYFELDIDSTLSNGRQLWATGGWGDFYGGIDYTNVVNLMNGSNSTMFYTEKAFIHDGLNHNYNICFRYLGGVVDYKIVRDGYIIIDTSFAYTISNCGTNLRLYCISDYYRPIGSKINSFKLKFLD